MIFRTLAIQKLGAYNVYIIYMYYFFFKFQPNVFFLREKQYRTWKFRPDLLDYYLKAIEFQNWHKIEKIGPHGLRTFLKIFQEIDEFEWNLSSHESARSL